MNDGKGLRLAYETAELSPDPSTQNGAVLIRSDFTDQILGTGFNTFPPGIENHAERWENRALKYEYVCHAEVSAIINASPFPVDGAVLYVPWYACTTCAKYIILAGVKAVVGHKQVREFASSVNPGWDDSVALGLDMLAEAGVKCRWFNGPIYEAPKVLVGGEMFDPGL